MYEGSVADVFVCSGILLRQITLFNLRILC